MQLLVTSFVGVFTTTVTGHKVSGGTEVDQDGRNGRSKGTREPGSVETEEEWTRKWSETGTCLLKIGETSVRVVFGEDGLRQGLVSPGFV